ncbi:MAG: Ig-like domain-containing protein [Pirellula sp.]
MIGFAERGEKVIGATPSAAPTFNPTGGYQLTGGSAVPGEPIDEIEGGTYQLEIREAADYGTTVGNALRLDSFPPPPLGRTYDTNDRLTKSSRLIFNSPSSIADGATFKLSDGVNTATFEFDVATSAADRAAGTTPGNVPITILPSETREQIARKIRDAINSTAAQAVIKITASTNGDMKVGTADNPANGRSIAIDLHGPVANDALGNASSALFSSGGVPLTLVSFGSESAFGEDLGDANIKRDQGQFIVSSNSISRSSGFGLNIDAAPQPQGNSGNRPYPGAVSNLVTLNSSNVAPGVVVMNNVLSGNLAGGINISGDTGGTTATGIAPQTVARVINNTLYGRGGDIGINVTEGASPSLLNNIIANFGIGINVVGAPSLGGTILGANLYQSNATTVTPASVGSSESFPILLAAGDPLFVDGPNGRFYLKSLSQAIDSSFSSLENRANIEEVKNAIGLPTSPILAPAFDVNGLRRSDDPAVSPPFGLGQNVFIDRGAIDRVDFVGPIAVLQRPLDNDSNLLDTDPFNTYVRLRTGNYDFFEVLLDERTGTGTDPNTITADSLILTENGRPLVQGVDYIFGFSANSRTIRLTPLAGFWRRDSIYEMTLINKPTLRVDSTSGATILDGARVTVNASNGAQAVLEFDSGFKLTVPQTLTFKVPAAGSASTGITDGQTFQISNGALNVTFEFDTNNLVTAGNRPIAIIADQTATQVRDSIVAALGSATNADLNLAVKGYGTDLIHLGTLAVHNASVGTSRLTRQGVASGVADGQTFMFDPANGPAITLEFNLTGDTAFGAGNKLITFDRTDTYIDLAGKIAAVMATVVPKGFAPVEDLKDGTVQIGGQVGDLLVVTGSQLGVTGTPGVSDSFVLGVPAAGGTAIADAARFSIRNAVGQTVVFEFDKDGTITPGNRGISIRNTDTADQIAVAISTSIAGSGLGITPTTTTRFIRLNEPRGTIVSVLTSGLVLTGVTGGAIPVPFVSSFNNNSVSAQLVKALSGIGLGVKAYALGYGTFIVEGVSSIAGVATTSIGPVSDLAGNWLLPNRVNSLTQFTILMPEVSVDYGDAIERPSTGSTSNTLLADNGVRHGLYPTGVPVLALGQFADGDVDGMPSTSADGDDFSSSFAFTAGMPLTLSPKGPAQLSVSAPTPAMLGARVKISDTVNRTVTYQFWDSSVPASAVPTGIVGVDLKLVTTASGAAAALQSEILKSILAGTITKIYAIVTGNVVSLGGTFGHTFDLSLSGGFVQRVPKGPIGISVNPTLAGLAAGQVLTIQDGSGNSVTFQIIDQAAQSALIAGNIPLVINFATATQASFAADVAKAINDEIQKGTLVLPTATVVGGTVNVNADDEDGVRFDGLFNPLIPPVPVVITSTDTGFIDAWVDWNQDNDFEDAGEKILSSEPVNAGENTFLISTPLNATVGYTTARFRLSATGGLFTYGLAVGGEVEDHVIEVLAGIPPVAVNDPDPSKAALYRVDEDNVLIVTAANGVLTNDLDPDNPAVSPSTTPPLVAVFDEDPFTSGIQPLTSTQNGTLVLLADGSFTYTPAPNFFGTDTFVYRVTDRRLLGNQPATVTITVNPVNDVPFANDDSQTIDEDIVQSWPGALFTGNDIKGITLPLPGTAIPNENPQALIVKSAQLVDASGNPRAARIGELLPAVVGNTISYTPGSNYNQDIAGRVFIRLEIEDNGVTGFSQTLDPKTAFSTLTVNIRPVNDRPLFDFPLTQTVSLQEDPVPAGQDVVVNGFVSNVSAGPILIPGLVGSADDELLGSTLPTPIVAAQTVTFILNTLAPYVSAFATLPSIGATGSSRDLTFKLKPDVNRLDYVTATNPNGSLFVEVIAEDNGPQGGLNLFRTVVQTITINIDPINDNPVVTNDSETIDEDIVQSWPGIRFTANDVAGPGNESVLPPDPRAQLLIVKSAQLIDSTGAVRAPRIGELLPTVSGNVVSYTPGSNYNQDIAGPVLIRLEIEDNGVSGFPTVVTPKSSFSTLTVNIRPVNDRPLFDFPLTQTVSLQEDSVPAGQDVVVTGFVSNVSAGPILIPGLVGSADDELLGSTLPTVPVPAQTVKFILNTPAPYNTAFATLPSIGATGSSRDLTFKLKPDVNRLDYVTATNPNGSLFVEVIAEDNGPQGGLNLFRTVVQTITINIDPVNDNPVVANDTETINEDIPQSWAGVRFTANDVPGSGNESGQTLIVKSAQLIDSTGAVRAPRSGELLPPVTGNVVNYTPGTHYNNQFTAGPVFILLEIQDNGMSGFPTFSDPKSSFSTLTVNINPVNDRPLFTLPITNIGLLEDPIPADQVYSNFVTGIAPGPTGADDELGNVPGVTAQGLKFLVRALNPASFTTQPRVVGTGSSRDFTFRLAPDVNALNSGPIVVEVYLEDLGPQGGLNQFQSPKQFVTINVVPVNDPPEFTLSTSTFSTTEDAPRTIIPGFMSAPTPGPVTAVDEINQNLTTTIVAANPAYFSFQPRLTGAGDLEFQLAPDVNSLFSGSLDILITVVDDGQPTAASTTKTLTITAADINDQPTFVLSTTNIVYREDEEFLSGTTLTEVPGFASDLLPGPITALDEFGSFAPTTPAQVLTFVNISVSNPTLFSQLPTIDGTGKLSFKTAPDRNGSAVVVVRLSDNGRAGPPPNNSLGRTATFTITLNAVNDAPEFTIPSSTTVNEDQGVVSLPGFATGIRPGPGTAIDENTQVLTFDVRAENPSAFLVQPTLQSDGTLIFQTAKDVNNNTVGIQRRVFVSLRDNGPGSPLPNVNLSAEQVFTVNINPVNDPPIPDALTLQGVENGFVDATEAVVLAGDVAGPPDEVAAGQRVRITQVERTTDNGGIVTPVFIGDRIVSFRYQTPLNFAGNDLIRYVVSDNGLPQQSATGTITITVGPINNPPQFIPGSDVTVPEDTTSYSANWATGILPGPPSALDELATQTILRFETPTDNDALFSVLPSVSTTGVLTFSLAKDAVGRAIVDVTAVDSGASNPPNQNRSITSKLTIVANPVNDAPGFIVIGDVSVAEDSNRYSAPAIRNIVPAAGMNSTPPTGLDEAGQSVAIFTSNNNPSLFSVQPNISGTGVLEFVPAQDASGIAIVSVFARDNGSSTSPNVNQSTPQFITVVIRPVNDAPVAVNDSYATGEDIVLTVSAPGVLTNDRDVDLPNDTLSVSTFQATSTLGAIVTLLPNGQFTYDSRNAPQLQRLVGGETATDTFTYTVRDLAGSLSNLATVTITVSGANDSPIAVNDAFNVPFGVTELLNVLANDRDPDNSIDPRTVEIGQLAAHGTATALSTGRIQYRPNTGYRGPDSFTYRVRDSLNAISNEATVTINVNTSPVAQPDSVLTPVNTPIDIDVLKNDSDPDGSINRGSLTIVSGPDVGTAVIQASGFIRFTPPKDFVGTANLQYVVLDDSGQSSNVANVTIQVTNSIHQNPVNKLDVNADGFVSPIDVLIVVNDLNFNGTRVLPLDQPVPPYLDVNGDKSVSPLDVLELINFINARGSSGSGEGEASMASLGYTQDHVMMVSIADALRISTEFERTTQLAQRFDTAVTELSGSPVYGPALSSTSEYQGGTEENLESLLAGWMTTKSKRSSNVLDSVFADEDWM